jgi:TP901 family phage tail tape measure protein
MAMQGKAQISVQVNLGKGTAKRLQSQLNAISRRGLYLNVKHVKIQNKQLQKSMKESMGQIQKTVSKASKEMQVQTHKSAKESAKVYQEHFKKVDKAHSDALRMNREYDRQVNQLEKKRQDTIINRRKADNQAILKQSQAINEEKIKAYKAEQKGLESIETLRKRITDRKTLSGQKVFDNENVSRELGKLQTQMDSFGKKGGASLKEINKQYGKMDTEIKKVTKAQQDATYKFTNTMKTAISGIIQWGLAATLVFAPLRAFKDGLQTLKEIDTALVDIAKVTNLTKDEMEDLAMKASDVGISLGRTTQEYLQAVAEFSRAGYGQAAEELAEVALLLQNVGDISSDTATKMLLAADASYQLGGSQEKLSSLVDMVNNVSNNNATSVAKMAEGISVSASIFAQAGVEIEDFVALMGTATSITQRSGSEIARGLRTVVLRLQGVTDASADSSEESISKAEEVLNKYGIAVRNSAEKLRAPMDVFAEISEKFQTTLKDNEVAQSEIIQRLAGQRQANVFAAIVNNWDMVQKQVYEAMYSTGSAMRENEIYMESWEAKSKQLSSSVAKFWQVSLNTDLIKGFIDTMRIVIDTLSEFGGLIPILAGLIMGGLTAAVVGFTAVLKFLKIQLTAVNALMGGLPLIIGVVTTVLTGLGYKFLWAGDAINTFNGSVTESIAQQSKLLKKEDSRIDNIDTMIKRYGELAEKEKRSKDENIELETIVNNLNTIYPELEVNINDVTGAYDNQITAVKNLTIAQREQLLEETRNSKLKAETHLQLMTEQEEEDLKALKRAEDIATKAGELRRALFDTESEEYQPDISQKMTEAYESSFGMMGKATNFETSKELDKFVKDYGKLFTDIGITEKDLRQEVIYPTKDGIKNLVRDSFQSAMEEVGEKSGKVQHLKSLQSELEKAIALERQILGLDPINTTTTTTTTTTTKTGYTPGDKTKDPSFESPVEGIKNEIQAQIERNKKEEELIEKEINRAKNAENYTSELELQEKLLSKQSGYIDDAKQAQDKLREKTNKIKEQAKSMGWNPETWFVEGTSDLAKNYSKIFNSLDTETQEIMKEMKDSIVSYENGWEDLEKIIAEHTEQLNNIPIVIEDINEKQKKLIEEQTKAFQELYKDKLEAVKDTESKIQDIIKYGVEQKKDLLDEELEDLKDITDKKIAEKEREWDAEDQAKRREKEAEKVKEIQQKINLLSRDTSLEGVAERKKLEEELADEMEAIQENREDDRRKLIKQTLQDTYDFKEEQTNKEKKLIDDRWNQERVALEASEILRKKSFASLREEFPALFEELKISSRNFIGTFESYELVVNGVTKSMSNNFQELRKQIRLATDEINRLFSKQNELNKAKYEAEQDRVMIGAAQSEYNKLAESGDTMETNPRMKELNQLAQGLRDKHGWSHEDLRGYKGSFSQGINAGLATSTGSYKLHGSQSNPEWILTNSQMYNVIKNLANNTTGSISPSLVGNSGGGMNLNIVVNGSPDSGVVSGVKQAGRDILREIKNNLKKKGN